MAIICNFVEQLRITLKQTFKLNIMENKNEALLRVTISTYYQTGKYRNNVVEIPISMKALEIIKDEINEMSVNSVSKYLANNQCASMRLIINDQCIGGIQGMCNVEGVDETWNIDPEW